MNQIDPIQDEEKLLTKTHWILLSIIAFLSLYLFFTDETRYSDEVSQKYVMEYTTICSHINSHSKHLMKTSKTGDFDIEMDELEDHILALDNLRLLKDNLVFKVVHDDRLASDADIFGYTDKDCSNI